MKIFMACLAVLFVAVSCSQPSEKVQLPIIGTWELISATSTSGDTTTSTFNPKLKMIKIINPTHFAFLSHDISGAKDSTAIPFSGGGGPYTLVDSVYTEHLDYFTTKEWEGGKFEFVVKISGDTLIQNGVEKVEKLGIDHIIVEKYKRIKN
ncbi:hypothetical protein [Flavihumibacter fluvii]|uniref:hypothetical protein n=1 Tax=Flavihumibacter fluvii TaxID=2838157 RepID=UPI001BDDEE1A|nr:hypothetical protein [Flavihumibacter fluvii]ULQ50879.1 hypothetical protein KJS93_12370 [Flavihumibacter fluvii]